MVPAPLAPGRIRVVLGDARTVEAVAPASVALVVTSPPYPMIAQWDELFHGVGARDFESMHRWLDAVWERCRGALLPGGLLAVNVGDALRTVDGEFRLWPNHARILSACERLGLRPLPYLLWKKPMNRPNAFLGSGFEPPNAYVTLDCEFVLLFRNGPLRRFPPKDERRRASRYSRAERDRWFSQLWADVRAARQTVDGRRTGAFPPELAERLIRMFSIVGDTILDPFAGTGTTLWAAERLGRNAVGIEIDPERYRVLAERAAGRSNALSASGRPGGRRSPR